MRFFAAIILGLFCAGPALADAVTYRGTLGGQAIVVELTQPSDGAVAGRYAYRSQGADIPLQPRSSAGDVWVLAEEAPCGEDDCVAGDNGVVPDPPIGAIWTLTVSGGGQALTGTWAAEGKSKALPIDLQKVGSRSLGDLQPTPYDLHDRAAALAYDPSSPLTVEDAPYDALRLEADLVAGREQEMDGSIFTFVVDPRTEFAFPRIIALADGSDPAAANQALELRHRRMSLGALDCKSFVYGGFGRNTSFSGAGGTLGGYEDELVTLTYLSPKVISWTEAGSLFCTGAHPYNHIDNTNLDVVTGQQLDLSRVFSGWVPRAYGADPDDIADPDIARANPDGYHWGPDPALTDWVLAHRRPDPFAEECGADDLVGQFLAIRFKAGDHAVFTLEGLPHAISACEEDLVTVPLADIPELLAPEAYELFPSLAKK
jgi:hypothetical protein